MSQLCGETGKVSRCLGVIVSECNKCRNGTPATPHMSIKDEFFVSRQNQWRTIGLYIGLIKKLLPGRCDL